MANVDAPFGLRPLRYLNGAPWTGAATKYYVSSAGSNLFIGDPVDIQGTTDATGKFPTVDKSTLADGNYTLGPIVAIGPQEEDLTKTYLASGGSDYVWVADDPNLIFEIQCDSVAAIGIADFGLNAIMVETHAGSTITGLSGIELDESSLAADASQMLMCLRLVDRPDNELALHANVEVLISMHRLGFSGAGDGRLGA